MSFPLSRRLRRLFKRSTPSAAARHHHLPSLALAVACATSHGSGLHGPDTAAAAASLGKAGASLAAPAPVLSISPAARLIAVVFIAATVSGPCRGMAGRRAQEGERAGGSTYAHTLTLPPSHPYPHGSAWVDCHLVALSCHLVALKKGMNGRLRTPRTPRLRTPRVQCALMRMMLLLIPCAFCDFLGPFLVWAACEVVRGACGVGSAGGPLRDCCSSICGLGTLRAYRPRGAGQCCGACCQGSMARNRGEAQGSLLEPMV